MKGHKYSSPPIAYKKMKRAGMKQDENSMGWKLANTF